MLQIIVVILMIAISATLADDDTEFSDQDHLILKFAFHGENLKYPMNEAGIYKLTLENNPKYSHFFNGSYAVQDVLIELLNNKSLTKSSSKKRTRRGDCSTSHLFGGNGGSFFRDPCSPNNIGGIVIRSGGIVDSIQTVYSNKNDQQWVPTKHGGSGGKKRLVLLGENEYIIAIIGSYGRTIWCRNCINELGFITENKDGMQVMHGPYGYKRGHLLMFIGQVGGFFGRCGQYVDAIGCFYKD